MSQADTSSPKAATIYQMDPYPPTPLTSEASSNIISNSQRVPSNRGHHIPILSVLEDAMNDAEEQARLRDPTRKATLPKQLQSPDDRYTVTNRHEDDIIDTGSSLANTAKKDKAKQALIAMLPPYDQLSRLLTSNSDWWQTWRRKCSGTSGPDQTLSQFAAQALTTGNIGAIGTVVLSVGICSSDESSDVDKYIETVDRWVLADDEYAATLEGMECLILKSKWYADVGQPRRAWIAYRKGLMYAQLMGLHRKRTTSAAHESIWWALFHGDRFLSLLLGLPYGINDSHCDLTIPILNTGEYLHPMVAVTKVSQLAGRVIDRNQGVAEQSFAWALQIDQELEDLWKQLDPAWLDYSELLADAESNAAELRERLMGQMCFHQIRVYLHLPFMLKSASNSRFTYSRTACLNGSREVLRLYQALRTGTVQPLYECKAIDFIGFTAAVLIQIGLLNFGMAAGQQSNTSPKDIESDIRLIEISIDIFRRASSEKGGKVALQSAEVLEKMMSKFRGGNPDPEECSSKSEFVIPYFGTISIKRGNQDVRVPPHPPASLNPNFVAVSRSRSPSQYTPTSENAPGSMNSPSASSAASTALFSHPSSSHNTIPTAPSSTHTHSIALTPKNSISAASSSNQQNPTSGYNFTTTPSPFATYNGFYNWDNLSAAADSTDPTNPSSNPTPNPTHSTNTNTNTNQSSVGVSLDHTLNDDSMNNFPLPTNNFSWQHMPMDIDQDWSWFLNDSQTVGAMGGVGAGNGQQGQGQGLPMEVFGTQGFTGFG
ncbi:hypothetical protein BKA63DRAFT_56390 [Paraphoma chrysanthemicola]|nr:hypothetical protein BKA63DRAFT_56390 [Paraphoma chrysanthemicola]